MAHLKDLSQAVVLRRINFQKLFSFGVEVLRRYVGCCLLIRGLKVTTDALVVVFDSRWVLNQSRATAAILIVQFHFCLSSELVPEVHWDVSAETELCFDAGLDTLNLRLSAFAYCGHVGFELFFVHDTFEGLCVRLVVWEVAKNCHVWD